MATICREVSKLRVGILVGILGGEVLILATSSATTELNAQKRWINERPQREGSRSGPRRARFV